ncbi:hypothetical protein EYC84_008230 [Monilinia fructicola]|uniref:Uncharacterized protein n=1 Tax=Monilinia fructicola TaxID=38448 RepID=A0A5M9JEH3_MONFR|nr:hypothetical protein EYC84_008230 [Monilinia fructicola]
MLLQVATQPKSHNLDVCQRAKRREEGKKKNEEVRKEGTLSPRGTGSLSLKHQRSFNFTFSLRPTSPIPKEPPPSFPKQSKAKEKQAHIYSVTLPTRGPTYCLTYLSFAHATKSIIHYPSSIIHHPSSIIHHLSFIIHPPSSPIIFHFSSLACCFSLPFAFNKHISHINLHIYLHISLTHTLQSSLLSI